MSQIFPIVNNLYNHKGFNLFLLFAQAVGYALQQMGTTDKKNKGLGLGFEMVMSKDNLTLPTFLTG